MLAVDLLSGWGLVAALLAAFLLIAAAVREGGALVRWVRRRFFPQAQLDARVRKSASDRHVLDVENTGEVAVEQVEIELAPYVSGWTLVTDSLARYPIPRLEPSDKQSLPVIVVMNAPTSVELTLRGVVDDAPYERTRTVSLIT